MKKLLFILFLLPALLHAQPGGVTRIRAGDGITISPTGGTGVVTINSTGGGGTPGGDSGDWQFNDAGAFGGFTPGAGVQTWVVTPSFANLNLALTGDLMVGLAATQSITGAKTFDSSALKMKESGGGSDVITYAAPAIAGNIVITESADAGTSVVANATLTSGNITIGGGNSTVGTTNISITGGNNVGNVGNITVTTINATTLAGATANGQLWIGNVTSGDFEKAVPAGTANQITVTASAGGLTWSTPSTFIAPGSIAATTTLAGTTLDTGQGANELYAMDQAVRTSDSPQFAGVNLGHATANTLTASGGVLSIEGNAVLAVGQTVEKLAVFVMPGGGSAITTGTIEGTSRLPFACTITGYSITATAATGTNTVAVWIKETATTIPVSGDIQATLSLTTGTAVTGNAAGFTDATWGALAMARAAVTVVDGTATDFTLTLYGTRL